MLLQLHQLREPPPADFEPGDLVGWARWYMCHLLNGGAQLDGTPNRYPEKRWATFHRGTR